MLRSATGSGIDAPPRRLVTHLRWMIGIRLVVITSVVLPYLLIELSTNLLETPAFDFLYTFAALTYGASLVYILAMRLNLPPLFQARIQFLGDLLLVTSLVYYFGSNSAFSILYFVVIMTAAAIVGSSTAISMSTVAWILYAGLSIATYRGWITSPQGTSPETISTTVLLYKLAVHLLGFYSVAILSSRLTRGVGQLERELEEQRESLADLELRHRDIIHSVPSGLLTTDLEGTVTTVNRAGEEILGVEASTLEGLPIQDVGILTAEDWDRYRTDPELGIAGPERNELDWMRGEEMRHIGYSLTPLTNAEDEPAGWVLVFQDLTRWRKLEEQIRLKDRMAAVGELAAGIAHELGNPLAAISGSVQMLSRSVDDEAPQARLLDIILKESQRLNRTIKGFLQFARPKERSILEFDVCRLLGENLELLINSREVSPQHKLELDLMPESATITADPDQISQLFWNLSRNALRAMPSGGTLRISGRLVGDTYLLAFTDTGRGMTEDERRRMFHPFQTGFVEGTGIGLSIVYRIVEEHSGRLDVESTPGQGTTISVRLPARLNALSSVPVGA